MNAHGSPPHASTASEREDQLAKVPFFDGLTREALSIIAQVTTDETHALGTRIFQYGDPGDKLFVILEGKVRISRGGGHGRGSARGARTRRDVRRDGPPR